MKGTSVNRCHISEADVAKIDVLRFLQRKTGMRRCINVEQRKLAKRADWTDHVLWAQQRTLQRLKIDNDRFLRTYGITAGGTARIFQATLHVGAWLVSGSANRFHYHPERVHKDRINRSKQFQYSHGWVNLTREYYSTEHYLEYYLITL